MNKKHIVPNTHLFLCLFLFIVFIGLCEGCAKINEIGWSIAFAVLELLPIFVFVFSPLYYVFSDEGVLIVYHFRQREYIKWNEIRDIYLMGSWLTRGGGPPLYVITYPRKEKRLFFVTGEIAKTRKTKKLLKKYYQKKIH